MVSQVCVRGRRLGLATSTNAMAAVRGGPVGVSWLSVDGVLVTRQDLCEQEGSRHCASSGRGGGGGVNKVKLIVRLARRAPAPLSNATPVSKALAAAKNMLPISPTRMHPFTCDECPRARQFTAQRGAAEDTATKTVSTH